MLASLQNLRQPAAPLSEVLLPDKNHWNGPVIHCPIDGHQLPSHLRPPTFPFFAWAFRITE